MKSLPTSIQLNHRTYQIIDAKVSDGKIVAKYKSVARGYEQPESVLDFDVEDLSEFEEQLAAIGATSLE